MTIKGVDISIVQGNVDFNWLVQQGIEFVIIRCGIGNDGADQLYSKNVAAAKAAGLKVMAYHFAYPLPATPGSVNRDPISQARLHYKYAQGELACLDIEWPEYGHWAKWGCTAAQINQWVLDYLEEYEKLSGKKIPVYTYPSFAKLVNFSSKIAEYPLWIASYTTTPSIPKPWNDWIMWQTAGGQLLTLPNGVPVDTNLAKDLSLWDENLPDTVPELKPVPTEPSVSPEPATPAEPLEPKSAEPNKTSFIFKIFDCLSKLKS